MYNERYLGPKPNILFYLIFYRFFGMVPLHLKKNRKNGGQKGKMSFLLVILVDPLVNLMPDPLVRHPDRPVGHHVRPAGHP
jgi:hypothetical protein